jgi:hypothetical protein
VCLRDYVIMWDGHNEGRRERKVEPVEFNFSLGHRIEIDM